MFLTWGDKLFQIWGTAMPSTWYNHVIIVSKAKPGMKGNRHWYRIIKIQSQVIVRLTQKLAELDKSLGCYQKSRKMRENDNEHEDVVSIHDLSERITWIKDFMKTVIVDVNDKHLQQTNQTTTSEVLHFGPSSRRSGIWQIRQNLALAKFLARFSELTGFYGWNQLRGLGERCKLSQWGLEVKPQPTSILVYSEREKTHLTAIIIWIFVHWNLLNF